MVSIPAQSQNGTLALAQDYAEAGLSVIPIRPDGTKAPAVKEWRTYQQQIATPDELERWSFGRNGIAIIGGQVSGNLEIIDFDKPGLFFEWAKLVEHEAPGLLETLPQVKTPRDDRCRHIYYRCSVIEGNQILASEPHSDEKTQKPKPKKIIETRGQGGYCLAPGCPPACHETGRCYEHVAGPALTDVPEITPAFRDILLEAARSLNTWAEEETNGANGSPASNDRPGDDFNSRAAWADILTPHGWAIAHSAGQVTYWRRPGKNKGWSATTGYCGERLYCFTTDGAPFEGEKAYSKFSAHALLNHGGDFRQAAKDLAAKGYGKPTHRRSQPPDEDAQQPTGVEIIRDYFRTEYQPQFRRGYSIFSERLRREVKPSEALAGAPSGLIDMLAAAADAPRAEYGVIRGRLPYFFSTWAKTAWADLLRELPEEDSANESESAAEEFRRLVATALNSIVSVGRRIDDHGLATDVERRSLIDLCAHWSSAQWQPIRSYRVWTRHNKDGQLHVAMKAALFGQVGPRELASLTENMFGRLAERHGIGRRERGRQGRVVVLEPQYVAELLEHPVDQEETVNG